MHAYHSTALDLTYSDEAPVLIAASGEAALARARSAIIASGRRIGAAVAIEAALDRLDRQARTGIVWVEIDRDAGDPMDALLTRVNRDVAADLYPAVIAAQGDCIDAVLARTDQDGIEMIVDPDESERAAALAIAASRAARPLHVSDIGSDNGAARLRQLSDEVNRIAATLARLSSTQSPRASVIEPAHGDVPPVSAERVRSVIRARRLRARYFSEDLFADPAWDMLLDLLQAEIAHLRVPVSSLCIAAAVPATTALRWLKAMVAQGLFVRRADPHDGRRVFVELSPDASRALHRYFAEVDGLATAI